MLLLEYLKFKVGQTPGSLIHVPFSLGRRVRDEGLHFKSAMPKLSSSSIPPIAQLPKRNLTLKTYRT